MIVFRRQHLLLFFTTVIFLWIAIYSWSVQSDGDPQVLLTDLVIVLDPGHGGLDPGSIYGDLMEKEVNLAVATSLKKMLARREATVYLTRTSDRALPHYIEELARRKEMIEEVGPDYVISLHVNSFANPACFGGQVFYQAGDEKSRHLAQSIQEKFRTYQEGNTRQIQSGDYYILRETSPPGVMVELGFIGNNLDRERFRESEQRDRIAESILSGLIAHLHGDSG